MLVYRLIIAGGRGFYDRDLFEIEVNSLIENDLKNYIVEIVSGMAQGADKMGHDFASTNGIKCHEFSAQWELLGRQAGVLRNIHMASFADGLIAFWDGKSTGTKHIIQIMSNKNKPVSIVLYD